MKNGMLIDLTLCVGCDQCVNACKVKNKLPGKVDPVLSDKTWATLETHEQKNGSKQYVRRMCMHCEKPACASVCPVGAFTKTELGAVVYDGKKCIGCRYCMVACPFSVPKYEWSKALPLVKKCNLCYDSLQNGQMPACAKACPTEATLFGERDKLLNIAQLRVNKNPGKYVPHIYGAQEVGGTAVLFLSDVPFEELGFRTDLTKKPLPALTAGIMSVVPNVITLGGLGLFGTYWIINRRMKLAKERLEQEQKQETDK
jgi:formate dehydrogenase iron-sulfur subunit